MTALAQSPQHASRVLRVGPLEIDVYARDARVDGRRVPLTRREYALLVKLASDPTRVFTRHELLVDVWGFPPDANPWTRTVDAHACRLRQKLRDAGCFSLVVCCWGIGYRLADLP